MPFVDVTIRNNGKEVGYRALVDSGAFANVFPASLAEILGIDYGKLQKDKFGGATDNQPRAEYGISIMELEFGGYRFDTQICFSNEIRNDGYGFVGRMGFFDHFKITFDYLKDNMWFTYVKKKSR